MARNLKNRAAKFASTWVDEQEIVSTEDYNAMVFTSTKKDKSELFVFNIGIAKDGNTFAMMTIIKNNLSIPYFDFSENPLNWKIENYRFDKDGFSFNFGNKSITLENIFSDIRELGSTIHDIFSSQKIYIRR